MSRVDAPGDAELISAVRGGDVDAYGELYSRHVDAARRLARQLVPPSDADDLVSEAFAKMLVVLQRGGGPDLAFRAYLLTAVRRLHVDKIRASSRLHTTDDLTPFDPGVPFRDTAVEGFESAAAARAFASLPERWQLVLWHTEVEGQKPAEVAVLLGMTANSVSALAYRAREGLRQAFLTMHAQELDDETCRWVHGNLGAYVREAVSRRDATRIENHLAGCRPCLAVYLELTEVNSNLSGILAPLLLGGLAAAYVGSATSVAVKGGVWLLLDRARELALSNAPATAVAGVAATAVVGGAVFMTLEGDHTPPTAAGASETAGPGTEPRDRDRGRGGPGSDRRDRGTASLPVMPTPTALTTAAPTSTAPGATDPAGTTGGRDPAPPTGSPQPPAPPAADLRVAGSATPRAGQVFDVVVTVAGLAPGDTATMTVQGTGVSAVLTRDDRCSSVGAESATCRVPKATTFHFTAVAVPGTDATVVFTVRPDGGTADPKPGNNSTTVPLSS